MTRVVEGATRLVVTGQSGVQAFNGTVNQIAIPDTATPGDLIVLALMGGYAEDQNNKARCADPRMFPGVEDVIDGANYSLSFGKVDVDRRPLGIELTVSTAGSIGHIVGFGFLQTVRMVGASSVGLDPGRRAGVAWQKFGDNPDRSLPKIPGLEEVGQGALCVVASAQVGIGGVEMDYAKMFPPWKISAANGTYLNVGFLFSDSPSIRPAENSNVNANEWRADVFGLIGTGIEVKGVTRQHPRDDGRGHSSGPRLYPPTKAQRIFGGYQ